MYRNQIEEFNVACSMSDCLRHDFNPGIGISANFFKSPLTYLLVNGLGTYYACHINMQATGILKFMNYGNRDAIERLMGRLIYRNKRRKKPHPKMRLFLFALLG